MADPKKVKKFWLLTAITGFGSLISFFQINSAFADEHKLNTVWLIAGIVLAIGAIYSIYQVSQNAGGGGSQER